MKLSIIVPIYNVEQYLSRCLESLFVQNIPLSDYEVICVNDCSPDSSRNIIFDFQKQYSNIILIEHTINKNLGAARNTGFYQAQGDYIWFVDSDDLIKPNCLATILSKCYEDNLDVLLMNYCRSNECDIIDEDVKVFNNSLVTTGIQFVKEVFGDSFVYHFGYVPRMIFSNKYLKNIDAKFPEGTYWEDTAYMPRTILLANRISSIHDSYYIYRRNFMSVSQVTTRENRADLIYQFAFNAGGFLIELADELKSINEEMSQLMYNRSSWYINSFVYRILRADNKQIRLFFELVSKNREFVLTLKPFMTKFNRFLCENQKLGFILTSIISPLYKLKNKLK